ncbi:MAG TPA: HAMP domain-containing sensor histidine kinase [Nocardioidaceae bacterium]
MRAIAGRSAARRDAGLAGRLLAAQVLVLLAGALTAWLVTAAIGPPLFHEHLRRAGMSASPEEVDHAEEAFRSANVISLSLALLAALVAALAVSIYVTGRIGRSVASVATAASDVAGGHYDARVPQPGLGAEFDELALAFNAMAGRLGSVEQTRRRMLADLAHEMRTPVSTMDAYLEGLEDGIATLDAETVALLRAQTRRLARLAEDISAVSRAEERRLELRLAPTAPAQLVEAAVAGLADRYAAKGVRLESHVEPDLPTTRVDPERIGQVLGNLLDNSLRHTPPGGAVTVSAYAAGPGIELAVSDNGEGIPPEHLTHVFERFYRVDAARDRAHGGSGIGLSIAKALVEAHGGRISVSSRGPGGGATFTVRLVAR